MRALWRVNTRRVGLRSLSRASQFEENQYVATVQPDGLPTNFFQKRLPRLPVPGLEASCKGLLNSLQVFLTPQEYKQSVEAVENFVAGSGKQLQQKLLRAEQELREEGSPRSYLRESFDTREASSSRSSILPVNEVAPFHPDLFVESERMVNLSNLIVSFLRFMKSIDDNVLSPSFVSRGVDFNEMMEILAVEEPSKAMEITKQYGAIPACPNRLFEIFRGSRVPRTGRDERKLVAKTAGVRHIVVLHRGRVWKVQVLDEVGRVCHPMHVWNALSYIRQHSDMATAEGEKIALCTAVHRDFWATMRYTLRQNSANRKTINEIDSALFAVALEDETFKDESSEARSLFLGEYGNRYLDKDFQLIANGNGRFAMYADELWATSLPVMRMMDEVADDIRLSAYSKNRHLTDEQVHGVKVAQVPEGSVQELQFVLNNDFMRLYKKAQQEYETIRQNCDVHVGWFPFGASFAKQRALSADFLVQQSIQTAYHSLFAGRMPVQTEMCSLGAFLDGRTELMLTTSPRTRRLAEMLNGGSPDDCYFPAVYMPLLVLGASAEHADRIELTRSGDMHLSHLLALRFEAQRASGPFGESRSGNEDVLAFLKSAAMKRLDQVDVDTAQVTRRGIISMPVSGRWKEGSARVTYSMQEEMIQYSITLMRNEVPLTARQFAMEISNAATRLRHAIERSNVSEDEVRLLRIQ